MLLAALLALLQDPAAEETWRKLEESIVKAKTVTVRFRVEGTGAQEAPDRDLRANGTMTLKEGGKMRLEITMTTGGRERKSVLIGDGKNLSLAVDGAETRSVPAAKGTEGLAPLLLARLGAMMSSFMPVGAGAPEGSLSIEVSGVKAGEDDGAAKTLQFVTTNKVREKVMSATDTRLWWDPKTRLPIKRVLTLRKGDAVQGTLTETYEKFELDADVPDETFRVAAPPPPPPPKKDGK